MPVAGACMLWSTSRSAESGACTTWQSNCPAVVGLDSSVQMGAGLLFGVHQLRYSLRHFSLQKCTGAPLLIVLIALPGTT